MSNCIFCKIVKGEIPALKVYETAKSFAFMDISPIAAGHVLVIPKYHGAKLHDIPDDYLADLLPVAKKVAVASGLDNAGLEGIGYNILQNNGAIAHQVVDHVHVHMIPKRDDKSGLIVGWPQDPAFKEPIERIHKELVEKLKNA